MPAISLTIEQMQEAVDAVEKHGSQAAAAIALGLDRGTFIHRYKKGVRAGLDEAIVHPAPQGHTVKGVSTLYGPSGGIISQWVKTKAGEMPLEEMIGAVQTAFENFEGASSAVPTPKKLDSDLATVYPLADWHIGLLAWHRETGKDYDLPIAQKVIRATMERLVDSAPAAEQAVVLGLGDLLHSDGYENQTTRSKNQLDVDGRYPKVLETATLLVMHTIDLALRKHKRVLVRILPGNHDGQSAIAVSLALAMFYRNEPRVTVDDDAGRFWFWSWGDVLLGATHGDMAKMREMPLVMAERVPEAWGKARFRHVYTGHIHTQTGVELGGVAVESFQTPVVKDAWHHGMGYGAGRSVSAITHHRTLGEIIRNKVAIV